jgi:hypothetical protein
MGKMADLHEAGILSIDECKAKVTIPLLKVKQATD